MARKDRDATPDMPAEPDVPAVEGATDEIGWTKPPEDIGRLRAQADAEAKSYEEIQAKIAERRARAIEARKKYDEAVDAKNAAAIKERRGNPVCPVVVQNKNGKPVHLGGGRYVQCLVPTMVTHRELRRLNNMRAKGELQLIVGEIQKPGGIVEPKDGKKPTFERKNEYRRWMESSKERTAVIENAKPGG